MAEAWDGRERRRHPRVPLKGEVKGKIHTVSAAPVIDLSVEGALLEVPNVLKPRTTYTLKLAVGPAEQIEVKGQVVRSYVHGFERNERGEMVVKYRAAVQFQDVGDAQKASLHQTVERLSKIAVSAHLSSERAG